VRWNEGRLNPEEFNARKPKLAARPRRIQKKKEPSDQKIANSIRKKMVRRPFHLLPLVGLFESSMG
jgi:hypothetical protein